MSHADAERGWGATDPLRDDGRDMEGCKLADPFARLWIKGGNGIAVQSQVSVC
jgi:hypothetical protein